MISLDFNCKNFIVTGGAGGIGREVVKGIVEGGGKVALVDIDMDAAEAIRKKLGTDKVSCYKVDLSKPSEIRNEFEKIIKDHNQIHGLINTGGIVSTKQFSDIGQDEWDRIMAINLTSVYAGIQSLFNHMALNKYGRIVNVASIAGKVGGGMFGTSAYATSKAGVIGLTKAVAKEGGKYGISCSAVCPGFTLTPMTKTINEELRKKACEYIPLGRPAEPNEVANLILFHASDLASYITGEISDVDGGITLD